MTYEDFREERINANTDGRSGTAWDIVNARLVNTYTRASLQELVAGPGMSRHGVLHQSWSDGGTDAKAAADAREAKDAKRAEEAKRAEAERAEEARRAEAESRRRANPTDEELIAGLTDTQRQTYEARLEAARDRSAALDGHGRQPHGGRQEIPDARADRQREESRQRAEDAARALFLRQLRNGEHGPIARG
jgi:hypothetical protein